MQIVKRRHYILARFIGFIIIALATSVFILQIPSVQTQLSRQLLSILNGKLNGDISCGTVSIVPGNGLLVTDIAIIDKEPYDDVDTVFHASSIKANFSLRGVLGGKPFRLRNVQVDGGHFILTSEPGREYPGNLQRVFKLTPKDKEPGPESVFHIRRVEINGFRFQLKNYAPRIKETPSIGFDWADLDVTADIQAHDLHFTDGRMHGVCDFLKATEKGGYVISELSGRATVGRGRTLIEGLYLADGFKTVLDLEELSLNYENQYAFRNFTEEVRLEVTFKPSVFSFETLQYFSGKESGNRAVFEIENGNVSGPVCDLQINGMDLVERGSRVSASVKRIQLNGVTDIRNSWLEGNISDFKFDSKGLASVIRNFSGKTVKIPDGIKAGLAIKGSGPLNHFHALIDGQVNLGSLNSELDLDNLVNPEKDLTINGRIKVGDLNPGDFIKVKGLGETDLSAYLNATLGKEPAADIDSLKIDRLLYSGYEYGGIRAEGHIGGGGTNVSLVSSDPNLKLKARAWKSGDGYKLDAAIDKASLTALGFEEKTGLSGFGGKARAEILSLKKDDLSVRLGLSALHFEKSDGREHTLDSLHTDISKDVNGLRLSIDSNPVKGSLALTDIEDFAIDLGFDDRERLLDFFVPGLFVSRDSRLSAMRSPDGTIKFTARSPLVLFGDNSVRNAGIELDSDGEKADLRIGCNFLQLGEDRIDNPEIRIYGDCIIGEKDFVLKTASDSSYLSFSKEKWMMNNSVISLDSLGFSIDNFRIDGPEGQVISADGAISGQRPDSLHIGLDYIRLEAIDSLLTAYTGIKGMLSADAQIFSPTGKDGKLDASVNCNGMEVSGLDAGELTVNLKKQGSLIRADVLNKVEGKRLLALEGSVDTGLKELDAAGKIDGFNLGLAQPLLKNLFSEMGGRLYGNFSASGKFNSLDVKSDSITLDNALLRIRSTNVPYTINGKMMLTSKGLTSRGLRIGDDEDGSGRLRADLLFNDFKKPELKAGVVFRDLKILGKDSSLEGSFYGRAYASGDIDISGPLKSMLIDVNATTSKTGQVHVPVGSALAGESKILSFKTHRDLRRSLLKTGTRENEDDEAAASGKSDIKIKANLSVRDNTQAVVEIDKTQGHTISVEGNGNVTLDIRPLSGVLDLGGIYNISSGKYHFSALSNIAVKDFTIQPGSSIKFNGKPKDSEFDITALYTRKASIAPLLTDTTSVAGMRTVECGLHIANKISNPNLKFSIDIPDLDPSTKAQVDGALNTEDKVQKQFVAFVLTGSFIPADNSGITFNGSNAVFSNISSMMSGQLNSILQNLNIPLDMGLNYQQTSTGKDMFDVAVSTQLFNNRVLVNGSVGSRKKGSSSSTDVVGDVDIEVKLNKSGQLRLKLFSHSADGYTNYLDNSQRNGVGLSYQREYSNFVRFVKSLFRKKNKGERAPQEHMRRERRMKTIKIDE